MAFGWLASNESGFLLLLVFFFSPTFCFSVLPCRLPSSLGTEWAWVARDGMGSRGISRFSFCCSLSRIHAYTYLGVRIVAGCTRSCIVLSRLAFFFSLADRLFA